MERDDNVERVVGHRHEHQSQRRLERQRHDRLRAQRRLERHEHRTGTDLYRQLETAATGDTAPVPPFRILWQASAP